MQVDKTPVLEEVSTTIKKRRPLTRPFFVLAIVIGIFIATAALVYLLPINNRFTRIIVSVIPYPAAMVNGSVITMASYANEHDALLQFLESTNFEGLPSDDVVQQTILDALVNKAVIRQLAFKAGVKIDKERLEAFYQDVVNAEESEEAFEKELKETFGWTTQQFKKRIIESIVLALQMSEHTLSDQALQEKNRKKIEQELAVPGSLPEEDKGVYSRLEISDQWPTVIDLNVGERTGILEDQVSFSIVQLVDKTQAGGEDQYHLKGVIVRKTTLEDLVREYLDSAKVRYFVR